LSPHRDAPAVPSESCESPPVLPALPFRCDAPPVDRSSPNPCGREALAPTSGAIPKRSPDFAPGSPHSGKIPVTQKEQVQCGLRTRCSPQGRDRAVTGGSNDQGTRGGGDDARESDPPATVALGGGAGSRSGGR